MDKILKIQKKAVRAILRIPSRQSCKKGFVDLNVMTVFSMYIYKVLLYAKEQVDLKAFAKVSTSHNYPTRRGDDLVMNKCSSLKAEKSPDYQAKFYFNMLPSALQRTSARHFKIVIKNMLTKCPLYTNKIHDVQSAFL